MRLVVADFVPSVPCESIAANSDGDRGDVTNGRGKYDQRYAICKVLPNFLNLFCLLTC